MLDALFEGLHVTKHHGRRAPATEFVPHAVHVEPVVGQHFATGDFLAHPIDQDLRHPARQTAQPCIAEPSEDFAGRKIVDLSEVVNLGRTKAVDIYLGESPFDVRQHLLVPVELVVGV